MEQISKLYEVRFSENEKLMKDKVWRELCEQFFQKYISNEDTLFEIACGFGEFSRHIRAGKKLAVDMNPAVKNILPKEIEFHLGSAESFPQIASASIDVCFTSNFFEHLMNKQAMDNVLKEVLRVLKPGGKFIMMQPNIKYAYGAYWDFYDHHLPLSHLSAAEGLQKCGYQIQEVIPKFVPFSTKSAFPKHPLLIRLYLKLPFIWKVLGKQFVIVAQKPKASLTNIQSATAVI